MNFTIPFDCGALPSDPVPWIQGFTVHIVYIFTTQDIQKAIQTKRIFLCKMLSSPGGKRDKGGMP